MSKKRCSRNYFLQNPTLGNFTHRPLKRRRKKDPSNKRNRMRRYQEMGDHIACFWIRQSIMKSGLTKTLNVPKVISTEIAEYANTQRTECKHCFNDIYYLNEDNLTTMELDFCHSCRSLMNKCKYCHRENKVLPYATKRCAIANCKTLLCKEANCPNNRQCNCGSFVCEKCTIQCTSKGCNAEFCRLCFDTLDDECDCWEGSDPKCLRCIDIFRCKKCSSSVCKKCMWIECQDPKCKHQAKICAYCKVECGSCGRCFCRESNALREGKSRCRVCYLEAKMFYREQHPELLEFESDSDSEAWMYDC